MSNFLQIYITSYITACLLTIIIVFKERRQLTLTHREYWSFLLQPWKIITFLVAMSTLVIIAPYSGDYTWDHFDAFFMSVLTFATAPWAVGATYKVIRKKLPLRHAFVTLCICLFSASWSYDLYLLLRDGVYPATWQGNMFASSALYINAGLLWNLDWQEEKGVVFSFKHERWPKQNSYTGFRKLFGYTLALMIPAALINLVIVLYLQA